MLPTLSLICKSREEKRGNMNNLFQKYKWLNKENIVVAILVGVLLLVIACPVGDKSKQSTNTLKSGDDSLQTMEGETEENSAWDCEAYRKSMEKQAEEILSAIDQVGKTKVFITLQASSEQIVEKDTKTSTASSGKLDGSTEQSVSREENTIYEQSGSSAKIPYVVKIVQPKVEGVLVVSEGAGSGYVNQNITEAIQVLFGIEAHKIKVAKMKSD